MIAHAWTSGVEGGEVGHWDPSRISAHGTVVYGHMRRWAAIKPRTSDHPAHRQYHYYFSKTSITVTIISKHG